MHTLTIATRGSKLALWQTEHVKARILTACPSILNVTLLVLKTKGDKILDVPLAKVGGKGLFVKEIEEALLDGRADFAVHSMKDVPMDLPKGLCLGAILEREDARDMFLSARHHSLEAMPQGARVGTSSLRRQAQLLAVRPDLTVIPLRGNIDTRLAKLMHNEFDAIIIAAAGVKRLKLTAPYMREISEQTMLSAAGQGALGLEYCTFRKDVAALLASLNHEETYKCVAAERGFLGELEGGCQTPIAAHAVIEKGPHGKEGKNTFLTLEVLLADIDGRLVFRETGRIKATSTVAAAAALGRKLAQKIKTSGGAELLKNLYIAEAN